MKRNFAFLVLILFCSILNAKSSGGGTHSDHGIPKVVYYQFLNFGILMVALIYFTKDKIANLFFERRAEYEKLLSISQKSLNEAIDKRDEVAGRIKKVKTSYQDDLKNAHYECDLEHRAKMQELEESIKKMNKDLDGQIKAETQKSIEKLRIEHFNASRELAEKNMLSKSTNNIRNSFSDRMKGAIQ